MSMNLHARTKKETIDLWQTPTQISYTILPSYIEEVKGQKAQEALERYIQWVNYSLEGQAMPIRSSEVIRKEIMKHLQYVNKFLYDETLTVWVM